MVNIARRIGFFLLVVMLAVGSLVVSGCIAKDDLEDNFVLSDKQQQALEEIRELVPMLEILTETRTYKTTDIWGVFLEKELNEELSLRARLTFDPETDELLSYSFNNPHQAYTEMPDRQFALEQADKFIGRVLLENEAIYRPSRFIDSGISMSSPEEEINWTFMTIRYTPYVHGLPLLERDAQVSVDIAGNVVDYSRYTSWPKPTKNLDYTLFPLPDQAQITPTEAERLIAEEVSLELAYLPANSYYNKQEKSLLAYVDKGFPVIIDAMTGETPYWYSFTNVLLKSEIKLQGQWGEKVIQNQSELENMLGKELGVGFDKMDPVETEKEYNEAGYYNWRKSYKSSLPGSGWSWHTITLNSQPDTGEIINIYTDYHGEIESAVFSKEEALDLAIAFLEKVLPKGETSMRVTLEMPVLAEAIPEWADASLVMDEGDGLYTIYAQDMNNLAFWFTPLNQGIPVLGQDYLVSVNLITGKVTSYRKGSLGIPADLPDAAGLIPVEQIKAQVQKKKLLQMAYIWPSWYKQLAPEPLLVYVISNLDEEKNSFGLLFPGEDYVFDALTGQVVSH
jgi:hypothetical protein